DSDLVMLRAAIEDRRTADVLRSAHRIKGAALTVGARPMARVAQGLEDAAGLGTEPDWDALAGLTSELEAALTSAAAAVTA
ncbi:MAG: Hpt domain-containing protein, partial [Solirubrobacteraceae bacterium]|nr:Hpt domain-containing protein [Solirubrobacteraceae bacterium]